MEQELGKELGRGASSIIYEWGNNKVLKLYKKRVHRENVERETHKSQIVHSAGLCVPEPGELIEIDGRLGLVFEKIDGKNMYDLIVQKPWRTNYYWQMLVELRININRFKLNDEMPSLSAGIKNKIQKSRKLEPEIKTFLLNSINKLPDGDAAIHGDFHPGNIMVTGDGHPVIIDWINACRGNPLADIARTWVILSSHRSREAIKYFPVAQYLKPLRQQIYKNISKRFMASYLKLRPEDEKELEMWKPIIAAVSLEDGMGTEKIRLKIIQDAFAKVN